MKLILETFIELFSVGFIIMLILALFIILLKKLNFFKNVEEGLLLVPLLLTFVSIFAIYTTALNSIFLFTFFIIIILFTYVIKTTNNSINKTPSNSLIIYLLTSFIIIFTINYISKISYEYFPFFSCTRDNMFYSNISSFLLKYKVETYHFDWYLRPELLTRTPYHYFDIWLTSLIINFFGTYPPETYELIVSPLLLTILHFVLFTFFQREKKSLNLYLFTLAIIIIINIYFPSFFETKTLISTIWIIYIFSIIYFIKIKNFYFVLILFLPLLTFNILYLPLLFIVPLYIYLINKKIKSSTRPLIIYFSFIFLIILYYVLGNKGTGEENVLETIYYYDSFNKIKTFIHFCVLYIIDLEFILSSILVILLSFVINKLKLKKLFYYFLVLTFCALIASLLHFITESSQVFTLVFKGINISLILILLTYLFKEKWKFYSKNGIYSLIIIISCLIISSNKKIDGRIKNYSINYLTQLKSIKEVFNSNGGRIIHTNKISSAYGLNSNCHFQGYPILYFSKQLKVHTLNSKEIPDRKSLNNFFNFNKKRILKKEFLYNFQNDNNLDINEIIEKLNIKYIFLDEGKKIPSGLKPKRIIVDSLSKEKLIIL